MFKTDVYCLEGEIWKDIPGYEGIYQASNLGRIRTVDGKVTHSDRHGVRRWQGRVLKNKTKKPNMQTGYRVSLWKNKQTKDWLVARLVAMAFYGLPKKHKGALGNSITVNHKDGNRLNNHVDNLEWVTLRQNVRHAFENGFIPTQRPIMLIDENNVCKEFRSMSETDRFLKKSIGYVSGRLKKGKNIVIAKDGTKYTAKLVVN